MSCILAVNLCGITLWKKRRSKISGGLGFVVIAVLNAPAVDGGPGAYGGDDMPFLVFGIFPMKHFVVLLVIFQRFIIQRGEGNDLGGVFVILIVTDEQQVMVFI